MNKNAIGIFVIAVLAAGAFLVFSSQTPGRQGGVYCGPDGALSDTMPIQSHRSYCIKSNAQELTLAANIPASYSFSIVDDQGNTLKDFAITHTKQMHVIVVRKDLANFEHLHPDFDPATGVFTLSALTLPTDGHYRIFADFAAVGGMMDPQGMPLGITLSQDVQVGQGSQAQPLGTEEKNKTFNGIRVALSLEPPTLAAGQESMLTFGLTQNGKPVADLEEHLGAMGHSVVLRESTLDLIHAHPMDEAIQNGKVRFMVDFPEAGKYKVFTQFQRNGQVFTTDFVVSVAEGSGAALAAKFDYLSKNGNSACTAEFQESIKTMSMDDRIKGSCCSPMNIHRYEEQIEGLKKYKDIPEIPPDPYDVGGVLAKELLNYYDTPLTPQEQAAYDYAMQNSHEKGPCCCKCWHWYVYGGLAKKLIHERGFTGQQIVEVWDLSDGCGGDGHGSIDPSHTQMH